MASIGWDVPPLRKQSSLDKGICSALNYVFFAQEIGIVGRGVTDVQMRFLQLIFKVKMYVFYTFKDKLSAEAMDPLVGGVENQK